MPSSGVCCARMPMEPTSVRVDTISTSSLKSSPSGVSTSTLNLEAIPLGLLRGLDHVVDRALQEERGLRHVVVLALDDLVERAHRLGDRDVLARGAGELLGDVERLREEALDLAGTLDGDLVLVRELVDAEDG